MFEHKFFESRARGGLTTGGWAHDGEIAICHSTRMGPPGEGEICARDFIISITHYILMFYPPPRPTPHLPPKHPTHQRSNPPPNPSIHHLYRNPKRNTAGCTQSSRLSPPLSLGILLFRLMPEIYIKYPHDVRHKKHAHFQNIRSLSQYLFCLLFCLKI